jgi:uncharacterized membrane protein HdeD (DUF308 family)
MWILGGLLYAGAGLVTIFNPALAAVTLTFVLAIFLMAAGLARIISAFRSKRSRGWGWLALSGAITALAGFVIALGWPVNGLLVLGLLLAIDLVFQGMMAIAFGFGLHRFDRSTNPPMSAPTTGAAGTA